jgi:hypothetical protein
MCKTSISPKFVSYTVYHIKCNPIKIKHYGTKFKLKQANHRVTDSPYLPRDTRVKVTLVARPLLALVAQKLCRCGHCVHEQNVSLFTHKSFAPVRVPFSKAGRKLMNKATKDRLIRKFLDTEIISIF